MSKYPTVTYKGKPLRYSDNGLVTRLMRKATKEELESVDSYINSISERVYTKADLIKELEEIKDEINSIQIETCTISKTAKDIQYEVL